MDKTCEQVFENQQLAIYEEIDESSKIEMERQNFLEKLGEAEEQRGSQGMGTDRDGPFTVNPKLDDEAFFDKLKEVENKVDYAWNYNQLNKEVSIPNKKARFDSSKNYYCEIESFAESIGFHMSQSNGIYTLSPMRPNPVSNDEEIAEFKRQHPEYRNMKGTQARNKTNGIFNNYKGNCETVELEVGFRHRRMLEWLYMAKLNSKFRDMLRYLKRNHYRKVTDKQITKNNEEFTTTFVSAAKEMGYLEASFNKKGKLCYQLTEKGKEYVRNI